MRESEATTARAADRPATVQSESTRSASEPLSSASEGEGEGRREAACRLSARRRARLWPVLSFSSVHPPVANLIDHGQLSPPRIGYPLLDHPPHTHPNPPARRDLPPSPPIFSRLDLDSTTPRLRAAHAPSTRALGMITVAAVQAGAGRGGRRAVGRQEPSSFGGSPRGALRVSRYCGGRVGGVARVPCPSQQFSSPSGAGAACERTVRGCSSPPG